MKNTPRCWLFDLDNTLYPLSSGLFEAIDRRINRYLTRFLDIGEACADDLRKGYFRTYGLTLIGLMHEHGIDPVHYLDYVHDVPLGDYLRPNPRLQAVLDEIPGSKVIFTNGSRRHSDRVTDALGISGQFEATFDITDLGYIPKPNPRAYRMVLETLGLTGPETVLVEDLEQNLRPARALGMTTVLVGRESSGADYSVETVEEVARIPLRRQS